MSEHRTKLRLLEATPAATTETESAPFLPPEREVVRISLTLIHHPDWELVGLSATVGERGAWLGRDPRACLPGVFDAGKISREHADVRIVNGRVTLQDHGSRNGTFVNGERTEHAVLQVGDVIGLGPILMMVTLGPQSFDEPEDVQIIGRSWPVARLLDDLASASDNDHSVILIGETGTGKELAAEGIHRRSARAGGELVAVNCNALSEGLIESELFGHARGAFTGAATAREGLVAHAEGGTLFLDEIASISSKLQTAMLRLLENSTYRAVGGNHQQRADVRIVAAAQPNIHEAIKTGAFRHDLWYRLSRRVVELPALRDRRQDIPLLARHFARAVRREAELSPSLSLALSRARWTGNIRELRNVVERIAEASERAELTDCSLVPGAPAPSPYAALNVRQRRSRRERPSRDALVKLLTDESGRVASAARRLGVERKTLYRWLEVYELDLDDLRT